MFNNDDFNGEIPEEMKGLVIFQEFVRDCEDDLIKNYETMCEHVPEEVQPSFMVFCMLEFIRNMSMVTGKMVQFISGMNLESTYDKFCKDGTVEEVSNLDEMLVNVGIGGIDKNSLN